MKFKSIDFINILRIDTRWSYVVSVHSRPNKTSDKMLACTGIIMTESIVLTAAHCFENPDDNTYLLQPWLIPDDFVVYSNSRFSEIVKDQQLKVHEVEKIWYHPKYVIISLNIRFD